MSCPECGSSLRSEVIGSTLVVSCATCGWSVARTYIEPIREDETTYNLFLESGNSADKSTLSCISKVMGCNFLQAKGAIDADRPLLFSGNAIEVRERRDQLEEARVIYSIESDFPY
ncbi:MAG: hypothetical protein IJF97_05525 [Eggerthellaceae bacterium]|nr:hypothetical protein [Eggerthellaceae bacterium]